MLVCREEDIGVNLVPYMGRIFLSPMFFGTWLFMFHVRITSDLEKFCPCVPPDSRLYIPTPDEHMGIVDLDLTMTRHATPCVSKS